METIENIKQRAATVKDATQAGENTATRVGGVLVDLTDVVDKNNQATNAALDTKATKAELTEAKKTQAEKDSLQDAELAKKADSATMTTELAKKFDKADVVQETGDAKDKVMSQKAVSDKLSDLKTDLKRNVLSISFDRSTGQVIGTTSDQSRITGCVQDRKTGRIIMNHELD